MDEAAESMEQQYNIWCNSHVATVANFLPDVGASPVPVGSTRGDCGAGTAPKHRGHVLQDSRWTVVSGTSVWRWCLQFKSRSVQQKTGDLWAVLALFCGHQITCATVVMVEWRSKCMLSIRPLCCWWHVMTGTSINVKWMFVNASETRITWECWFQFKTVWHWLAMDSTTWPVSWCHELCWVANLQGTLGVFECIPEIVLPSGRS